MVTRAAGLVIFRQFEGKIQYLLLKASNEESNWTPPKGHVDPGENEWVAALRETTEEAGIDPVDLDIYETLKETLEYKVRGKDKAVVYWVARLKDPLKKVRLSHEHTDFSWAELEGTKSISKYQDFNAMLDRFHERIVQMKL